VAAGGAGVGSAPLARGAAVTQATYLFQSGSLVGGAFKASESGVTGLKNVDPLGTGAFQTATVYGSSRTVYHYNGSSGITPINMQGGFELNTTGLVAANDYSVEMVICLDSSAGWRRLLGVDDRQTDSGLYVAPSSNELTLFPVVGGGDPFTTGAFHYLAMTDTGNTVKVYLDGKLEVTSLGTTQMNINNASNLLTFFLDNTTGPTLTQTEWSAGKVAMVRLSAGALTDADVAGRSANPFSTTPGVPLPGAAGAGLVLLAGLMMGRRRSA
jgi:hypothetical protein